MIRGINRKVIEIKNCDSAYFERAFLIVKSDKSDIGDDMLNFNAELFVKNLARNEKKPRRKAVGKIVPVFISFILGISLCALVIFCFFGKLLLPVL